MNGCYYISNDDYYMIRNGLLNENGGVIKTSIQSLIIQLEENKLLNHRCSKDLCAILYKAVQNPDPKIRKWVYHLIAYKNTPDLIMRCIKNLQNGIEDDNENITWIMAIASTTLNQNTLYSLYKQYAEDKICESEYKLCTVIFSPQGAELTKRDVRKIVGIEGFLTKMWLTKMYACVYKETRKKQYKKVVNHKVMNELLQEEALMRYVLWAFSTFQRVDLRKISIRPYNAVNLHIKSQAWYYNCMFKDERYVYKNRDHIGFILENFTSLAPAVQGGILRGLEGVQYSLGYMESKLVEIYFDLDEEKMEDVSLLISLTRIFLKHVNESDELKKVLSDIKANAKIGAIKKILFFYNYEEKGIDAMRREFHFYGPVQYIEKAENINQVNSTNKIFDTPVTEIAEQIADISESLKNGFYDHLLNACSPEFDNMITNVAFELSYARNLDHVRKDYRISDKLSKFEQSVTELKSSKALERKMKFFNVLTKFSEACTVISAVPQLVGITQSIMEHIKTYLNI